MNPLRQAQRFDRSGDFVRRYVPELRGLDGKLVHEPWRLPYEGFSALAYPLPILDLVPTGRQMALQV
jgi:deoxyribodipyrimidine photo-lyase